MDHGTPEQTIVFFVVLGIVVVGLFRFFRWLFSGPLTPDPWGPALTEAVDLAESEPVCHRCLTEHSNLAHFCPNCGAAVGDYNNVMPFEHVFSEGEVFRNGTTLKTPPTFLRVTGYFVLSLGSYFVFAPIYWFFLLKNFSRSAALQTTDPPAPSSPPE
jgi:hypothetical protein